ncbi:MAG TPA: type II secretion system F family protein, partial [Kofleriaceae bacterium]|nr:type II secretion system F family protein [Kofleriaceae bacterium]
MRELFASDVMYGVALAVAAAAAVALVVGIRYVAASGRDVVKERLRRTLGLAPLPTATVGNELAKSPRAGWEVALEPIARVARPGNERELGRLRSKLSHAGLRSERALVAFLGAKVLAAVVLAAGFLVVNHFWPQPATYAALYTIASTALGFYAPSLWLMGRISERRREINHALPNALDLLVTCVEAGLGLEAAIQRVAGELDLGAPLLAKELEQTELEMRAGVSRGEAFRRMADRTGVEELRNLSAIIIQTQIFGTSIARSPRVQADAMRVRRMQLAE